MEVIKITRFEFVLQNGDYFIFYLKSIVSQQNYS